jgi:hypothetical protein
MTNALALLEEVGLGLKDGKCRSRSRAVPTTGVI